MQIKGARSLRSLNLTLDTLTPEAKERLSKRLGDILVVDITKRYHDHLERAIAKAYSAYLRAVADYLGRRGDSEFKIPGGLSRYRSMVRMKGPVVKRKNPLPERGPAATIQISFSVPVPTGDKAKSLLGDANYAPAAISFSVQFEGLARSTLEKKVRLRVARFWKQSGNTATVIGSELRSIARGKTAVVVSSQRRRVPIQADFRPAAAKPFAKYSLVTSVRLKGPKDPAWAELIAESFASGVSRAGVGSVSAFGTTPVIRSIFNEVGFQSRNGTNVPARGFIQQMGVLAGQSLFQQLQRVKA